MREKYYEITDQSNRESLLCGNHWKGCRFRGVSACFMIGRCLHQITREEVLKDSVDLRDAMRPQ